MMHVRPATLTDLPELRRLFVLLCAAHPMPYPTFGPDAYDAFVRTLVPALLTPPPTFCALVADHEDFLGGFFAGEISMRTIGVPTVFAMAHYLIVDPRVRGRFVARDLIRAAQAWCQTHFPDVHDVEVFGVAGDPQWQRRGWTPMLVRYHRAVSEALTPVVSSPPAPEPPADVPDEGAPDVDLPASA